MTEKITLYTPLELLDAKGNFTEAIQFLNEKRKNDGEDYENFSIHVQDMIDYETEKLDLLGLNVKSLCIGEDYRLDVELDASVSHGFNSPFSHTTKTSILYTLRKNLYPSEFSKPNFTNEEWEKKVNDAELKVQEELKGHEEKSFISKLLSEPEHKDFIDELEDKYDFSLDFLIFNTHNTPFDIDFYRDCTAYQSLQHLYEVLPNTDVLDDYYIPYTIEGEGSKSIQDNSSTIWDMENRYVEGKLKPIIQKGTLIVEEIVSELKTSYRENKQYFYSDEYLIERLDIDYYDYNKFLFTIDGEFICSTEEFDDIFFSKNGKDFTSENFIIFGKAQNHESSILSKNNEAVAI